MKYEVELYGNTGAGKTVLLTALYHFVVNPDNKTKNFEAKDFSENLREQRQRLLKNQDVERTKKDIVENLSFQLTFQKKGGTQSIDVVVTAHAGEDHVPKNNQTNQGVIEKIKAQFISNDNKLLVIVVNPFLHDLDLTWKAFRNLVAYLQERVSGGKGQPLAIKEACYAAANILFHIPPDSFTKYFIDLEPLFQNLANARLVYARQAIEPERGFRWENCDNNVTADFNQQLKDGLEKIISSHQGDRVLLQNLMKDLKNSMLVLSHVDLASHLKSIDVEDFDKVFNLIFANPNRSYRRQLLAKNLILDIRCAENGRVKVRPIKLLTQTASQFYENIKSFAIEPETAEGLPAAPVEESEKTPLIDLSPLVTAIESLVIEEKESKNKLIQMNATIGSFKESLVSQMQEGVSQAKQGKNELNNIKTEIGCLTKRMGEIYERIGTLMVSSFFLAVTFFILLIVLDAILDK